MTDEPVFTHDEAVAAQTAMRDALGLGAPTFATPEFVAMLSDEIVQLREAGRSDADISRLIADATGRTLPAASIARHVRSDEERAAFRS